MLDTIYIGMSGLTSFSKGLSNISNNVANLNTTGFKGSDLQFSDLYYQHQYAGSNAEYLVGLTKGSGVTAGASATKFTQGEFRQTGNDLDAAIDGNGFFILQSGGKLYYTRAGQFQIDGEGRLVAGSDDAAVMGLVNGAIREINISGSRSVPAKATTEIRFANTLSLNSPTYELTNITAIDSLGSQHQLTLNFVNDTVNNPGRWTFRVLEGTTELANGSVTYNASGSPVSGSDTFSFTYAPAGALPNQLTLNFSGTTFLSSSSSSLQVSSQNGVAAGFLTKTTIDQDGFLVLTYSNGQSVKSNQLALADFQNLSALQSVGSNRFEIFGQTKQILSTPGSLSLGKLRVSGIELSNVDLAREFSELIIVQRAYQASSQVISAANEMMQQLGEIRGRR
ncbi:flagellar basal-body rod protein FlgF [Methylophilaceae bacterium 11]|nr:flagellar basal-body rod protein FlgF [Methylophilaceae bacterium 11]